MKLRITVITASIAGAALLAAAFIAPHSATPVPASLVTAAGSASSPASSPNVQPSNETSTDALYSAQSLPNTEAMESAISAMGACNLPAAALSKIIASWTASNTGVKALLSGVTNKSCAEIAAVASVNISSSALTSVWAWGNPVSASDDARGLGQAAFAPATLAAFAASRNLGNVRLSVPWAADQGTAIGAWLSGSVSALHANNQTVSALGGDTAWVANPTLVSQWITSAHRAAAFDGVQLDIEPWTSDPNWTTNTVAIASYIATIKQARTTAHSLGLTLGVDAPWWLGTTSYGSGTVLSSLLGTVDSVSIVAFSDHAGGDDGIIAQAWPAVIQSEAALVPFTIGVQTSSDAVSGGSQYTFADKGSAALETESNKVRAAYSTSLGYSGITVEEYLSWSALK